VVELLNLRLRSKRHEPLPLHDAYSSRE